MKHAALLFGLLWAAHALATDRAGVSYEEDLKPKAQNFTVSGRSKGVTAEEVANFKKFNGQIETARLTYQKYNSRVRVPGFISSSPVPQIGRIIGPIERYDLKYRVGDVLYVRWAGAPLPKPGDRYSTYTPAVVIQNLQTPSEFDIFNAPGPSTKLPKGWRLAGFYYETTGRIRVSQVKGGLVHCVLEGLSGIVGSGDEVMKELPLVENITPIDSGIQLSATVVSGSPAARLSTTQRSFIYLNRGSRDGIRVGRVFEALDTVQLNEGAAGSAPELSSGEAIVVHVTDSYSTAMITKQFDVIRIGSALRTKQLDSQHEHKGPFSDFVEITPDRPLAKPVAGQPEIPSAEKLPGGDDESLPEPRKRPSGPALSELDELEQSMKLKSLTPAEKARLEKLSHQEHLGESAEGDDVSDTTPGAPTVENSFQDSKKPAKKPGKKSAKTKNDEEELNLLMMQN
jgi:hypothetical protein